MQISDSYQASKPSDKTILEPFKTVRFSDCKEKGIDLLQRVCRVSVETVQIIQQLYIWVGWIF